ncbi:SUKH-4 family immunity protein [Streptomyces sp. NPDC059597]|uniref:SUKH-4 family immunity protein n=1 Tax=Streptomyces sp. NPDC059597 TaxID=3346879 RepID=UPI0036BAC1DD
MNNTVTGDELVRVHGLARIVYFPQYVGSDLEPGTATFLSTVGLPSDRVFLVRADAGVEEPDPIELGPLFALDGDEFDCPPERRHWPVLGYLRTTLLAIDPESGEVHAYMEGDEDSVLLHHDVESLAFCLTEFRKLLDARGPGIDLEAVVHRFREAVTSFDPTPLENEESEWNIMLEEILDGMW